MYFCQKKKISFVFCIVDSSQPHVWNQTKSSRAESIHCNVPVTSNALCEHAVFSSNRLTFPCGIKIFFEI